MTDLLKRVQTEIDDIHAFFTDWVNGTCPGDEDTFRTNALDHMADNLVVTMPAGRSFGKSDFAGYMSSIYGSNPDFKIKIRDLVLRHHIGSAIVVNYKEWQRNAQDSDNPNNGRQTTMVLRELGNNGFEFLQVHETWLPPEEVENGDFSF
jgi:hypothetical protein